MNRDFDVEAGQIWLVKHAEKIGNCKAVVLLVETIGGDCIVHIALIDEYGEAVVEHMPFSKATFCNSVTELLGKSSATYDLRSGYNYWCEEYERGAAGIFGTEISECAILD
ncbi:hypothetical protein [Sphingopyxis sp.]|uniref:hypothetical protein n=1 Tax=Sphingopyxis sp. TaxID=1908224 RepID=UPI003D113B0A